MSEQKNKLLEVKDLKVSFFTPEGEVKSVGVLTLKNRESIMWRSV